jgi:signal transduction histidine kinase
MSNYYPALQEFVTPLAICQPETDLGNILSIFQHLNCKMLAIPQDKLGWGIIYAEDLLSLITKAWLGDRIALTSHPRNITYQTYQHNLTYRLTPEVKTLIKPVVVYQAETTLNEFLHHRLQTALLTEEQICLIVNHQGELLGRLDRDKIIQYLALKSKLEPFSKQSTEGNHCLASNLRNLEDSRHLHHLAVAFPGIQSPICKTLQQDEDVVKTSEVLNYQLLGTVSHELKSPLTGIVGLSSLLQAQKLGNLNQRQGRYVELIYQSGKKMMAVVDDLLHLTALMADPPQDSEEINLELLCYQLHQEVLTRVKSSESKLNQPNLPTTLVQPQLRIELEQEITIPRVMQGATHLPNKSEGIGESFRVVANKLLLSSVLSHLMLEAIIAAETDEPLDIQIKSLSTMTAIIITGQAIPSLGNSGLNLMVAKCLSELLEAEITHACSKTSSGENYQFTLTLPLKVLPSEEVQSSKLKDTPVPDSPVINNSKANNLTELTSPRMNLGDSPLTILWLNPELEVIDRAYKPMNKFEGQPLDPQVDSDYYSNFDFKNWLDNYETQTGYQHRIIEADSLEQAHNLARIWQLDAIILNGHQIVEPSLYLRSLQESLHLATLPLITLDARTTEAANQIEGLNVYPCLLPAQQRNIADLIQVIQIAIES